MNKAGGFIAIHRQILDWEWYKDTNTVRLFIHLLLTANFVDGRFEGKTIKRGQLVTSLARLAEQTTLSVHQVRVSLEHLLMTGEVTSESCNRYRVITVVKYDEYQKRDKQTGKQMAGEVASERQADGKQMASNVASEWQQYNNVITIDNKGTMEQGNNNTPSVIDITDLFNEFWNAYPKKVAKQAAEKAWMKLKPFSPLFNKIMDSLEKWKLSDQWQKDGGQFIPNAATWLNGKRWEDEVPEKKPDRGPAPTKTVTAQQYTQRSYEGEQEDAMKRMVAAAGWAVKS